MVLTTEEIIRATGGNLISEKRNSFSGVSIDSRTVKEGEIFFALRGPRFDGHDFIKDAVFRGAEGVVIKEKCVAGSSEFGVTIIVVHDALKALQDLAHSLRVNRNIPVVAVTGSNGKTTTKEMIYKILSARFRVLKNDGNLNNHIGVPLSFMRLSPDDEMAVLEFGMNAPGEIRRLCEIAVPTCGVITNIGHAHIGQFGSLESVRNAKLELLDGLQVVVLNADDDFLMQGAKDFKGEIITFSIMKDSKVKAENVAITDRESKFTLVFKDKDNVRADVALNIHGIFNVYNALAASAVCFSLGITIDEIKKALEDYSGFPMRFEVLKRNNITLINDSYNANPSSMAEALKGFACFKEKGRLVAALGDMNELGRFSEESHRAVGRMVSEMGIDVFIAVGEKMSLAAEEIQSRKNGSHPVIYKFSDSADARQKVSDIIRQGDTVLVKGSRSMGMEKIIARIKEAAG